MFRYLCLAWEATDAARSKRAQALVQSQAGRDGWRTVLVRPGLHVFTTSRHAGSNQTYSLGENGGIVLGRLFRRSAGGTAATALTNRLTDAEAASIHDSACARLVDDYWGRYIALQPADDGSLHVLRDPSGTLPCLLWQHDGVWLVCSWLEDALALVPPARHPRPDSAGVRAYLLGGTPTGTRTTVSGVDQVLPGERVRLRGDRVSHHLLWSPLRLAEQPLSMPADEAAGLLRDTVRHAVRQWAAIYDRIVLRLSGGVDSSILAGCLAPDQVAAEVLCLNIRWADPMGDERGYARLAATKARRRLHVADAETGIRLDELLTLPRLPSPRASVSAATMVRIDAAVAGDFQAPALFTGAAGDLVFFEVPRWWPAADYLQVNGMDLGFPAALLDAAQLGGVSVWAALAMAARERWRRRSPADPPTWNDGLLSANVAADPVALAPYRHPVLHRQTRLPIGKWHQVQQLLGLPHYYEPLTFHSSPEPVHPLLSQPVVELALRIPTFVLAQGGRGRALARLAFSDSLPVEVAQRRTKGTTTQAIKDILQENLGWARGILLGGELERHGLLDRRRLEQTLTGGPAALAASAWNVQTLIEVEAWLRCWSRPG